MANDFFDAGDYTELTAHTLARANSVNAIFGALVTGFDRLPPKLLLDQDRVTYATEGGGSAANVYVYTLPKTLVAYTEGLTVKFKTTHVNTGASTINIDALGAKAILRGDGTALVAGDIPSGAFMMIGYDGSAFRVLSGAASLSDLTAHAALTAAHGATGAVVGTTNSQTLTNKTLTSPAISGATLSGTTVLPGSGAISSAGLVGIGMTPVNILDITQTQNASSIAALLNASAGASARAIWRAKNDLGTHAEFSLQGGSYTPLSSYDRADGGMVWCGGAGGFTIATGATGSKIYLVVDDTEIAKVGSSGIGIGTDASATYPLAVSYSNNASSGCLVSNNSSGVAAGAGFVANNGTSIGAMWQWGNSFTPSGIYRANGTMIQSQGAGGLTLTSVGSQPVYIAANEQEVGRFTTDNGGALIIGATAVVNSEKFYVVQPDASEIAFKAKCTHGTPASAIAGALEFTASPDNNTAKFLNCSDGTTNRLIIYSDGDVQNHDNSYGAISDEKLKRDVKDYDVASQWDDFKAIRLRKYRLISDVETKGDASAKEQLGVIAQELEAIMPGLVRDYPDTEEVELEPARTEVRRVKRPRTETVTVRTEELTEVAGRMILAMVERTVDRPVMEELPVVDNLGDPVMELVKEGQPQVRDPKTSEVILAAEPAVYRPRMFSRPVIDEVDEVVVIPAVRGTRLKGTSTKGVLYSILNLKTVAVVQELMRRVEALEAKVGK